MITFHTYIHIAVLTYNSDTSHWSCVAWPDLVSPWSWGYMYVGASNRLFTKVYYPVGNVIATTLTGCSNCCCNTIDQGGGGDFDYSPAKKMKWMDRSYWKQRIKTAHIGWQSSHGSMDE